MSKKIGYVDDLNERVYDAEYRYGSLKSVLSYQKNRFYQDEYSLVDIKLDRDKFDITEVNILT